MEQKQYETIKFTELNKDYNFVLTFDKPQEYANERYGGTTICYGAKYNNKEVRFYASPGLHEEIKKQGLKKDSDCVVRKVKPGDFPFFIVNGESKHLKDLPDETANQQHNMSNEDSFDTLNPNDDNRVVDLLQRVSTLEKWREDCNKDDDGNPIPF